MKQFYNVGIKCLLVLFTFSPVYLSAQQLIYRADFSGVGRTTGNGWTSRFTDGCNDGGFFGTDNGQFRLTDMEGQGCLGNNQNVWIAVVDISNFSNVEFLVSASGEGNPFEDVGQDGEDLFEIEVSVDGDRVYSDNLNLGGQFFESDDFEDGGFCGEELEIFITFGTQSPDESLFIDLVEVFGDRTPAPSQFDQDVFVCAGNLAELEIEDAVGATVTWFNQNGNQVGSGSLFTPGPFTNAQVGQVFEYTAEVETPNCDATNPLFFDFFVEVQASLGDPIIFQDGDEFCLGEPIDLEVEVPFGNPSDYDYEWFLADGSSVTTNVPFYTIPNATAADDGVYEVILFYNGNANVCEEDINDGVEAEADIFVLPGLGDIEIIQDGDEVCLGDPIDLEVEITVGNPNDYEYEWVLADGTTVTTNIPIYTIPAADAGDDGLYEVFVFYNGNADVCEFEVEAEADIFVLPGLGDIDIAQDGAVFCEGDQITLTVDVSFGNPNDYEYEWILADGSIVTTNIPTLTIPNATQAADGIYDVLAFYNGNELVCEDDLDDGVEADADILVGERPNMPMISSTDICEGLPTLSASIGQNDEIFWYDTPNVEGNNFLSDSNTFTPSQAGTYYVVAVNADGCESETLVYQVEEVAPVEATIAAAATTICEGSTTTLTASGGTSYIWSTGATTPQIQAPSGAYSVTVFNGDCDATRSITIQNFPTFEAQITGTLEICAGETTTLQASAGQSYEWSNGATGQSITVGAGNYSVIVTNANGCTDEVQVQVDALPEFEAQITGTLEICAGETTTLQASAGQSYEWSNGATGQSITVGAGNYSVIVTNANGCTDEVQVQVDALPEFEAQITGTLEICAGETTTLQASAGQSYEWSNGATGQSITVGAGNYSVIVTNANGCTDEVQVQVDALPEFEAQITGTLEICAGETTTLQASAGQSYEWSNGATGQSITVGAGNYSVIVTNANGCTDEVQVQVDALPEFEAQITGTLEICAGETTTLQASAGQSYEWSNGATGQSITVGAGNYSVIVTNANGCTDEVQVQVNDFPDFEVEISGVTNICEGTQTTLTATNGFNYTWSTGETTQFITAGAGTYTVEVTNSDGCTDEASITINSIPLPTLTILEEPVCNDNFIGYELTISTEAGNTVTTSAGTVTEVSTGNFSIDNIPTNEDVIITVVNSNDCQIQQTITAPDCSCPTIAAPTASSALVSICEGETIPNLMTSVSGENVVVDWYDTSTGGNLLAENTFTFQPTMAGIYYAQSRNTDSGCPGSIRTPIELRINTLPDLEVVNVTDITCKDDFGSITVNAISGTAPYEFSVETGTFQANPTFENLPKGVYTIIIRDANGCENQTTATIITNTRTDVVEIESTTCDLSQIGRDTTFLINELGCDSLVINIRQDGTTRPTFLTATTCEANQANDTLILQNVNGCDSLVITEYNFVAAVTTTLTANTCDATQLSDTLVLQSVIGCDSLVVTNYTFVEADTIFLMAMTCEPSEVGESSALLQNEAGCDSLIITTTTLIPADTTFVRATSCDPLEVGENSVLLQNQIGCDSLVITTTTLILSDTTLVNATSCDPAAVGEERLLLQNQAGCDSLVIITTTLSDKDEITFIETTCDPSLVGIDTTFFINRLGCDSLVITATTLQGTPDTTLLERITCDFEQVGLDTLILQNQVGCDSVVITNSIFDFPDAPRVNISSSAPICQGDTVNLNVLNYTEGLQWLKDGEAITEATTANFKATEDGTYAVTYTNDDGCAVASISFEVEVIAAPIEPFFSNIDNLLSLEKPEAFEGLSLQWFLNDEPIEGATEPTYCSEISGTYILEVTDTTTGCAATHIMEVEHNASIENCNLVNTATIAFDRTPNIYPNPFSDLLFLDLELTQARVVKVEIIDLFGRSQIREIIQTANGNIETQLTLSHLPNGIYWLKLEAEDKIWATKIIKQ